MAESRTQKLLEQFKLDGTFLDTNLPKGFFSNSQYNSWLICGKAYEYKYVDRVATPDYASTTRGNAVHAGIEFLLRAKMARQAIDLQEGLTVVSDAFDEKARGVTDWGEEVPGLVKDTAIKLFKTYAVEALPRINPIAVEKGFAKRIGDVPMVGWIDVVDEQPAIVPPNMSPENIALAPRILVTADLKTGRAKWSENEVNKDPQLTLYAHVEGTPHVRIDQLLAQKRSTSFIQAKSTRNSQDTAIYIDHLNQVADFVRKGVFPKTQIDNWACNKEHCSFYHLCRGSKKA